jgi:hypothetical protein
VLVGINPQLARANQTTVSLLLGRRLWLKWGLLVPSSNHAKIVVLYGCAILWSRPVGARPAPSSKTQRYSRMARTRRTPALEDSSFTTLKRPSFPVRST